MSLRIGNGFDVHPLVEGVPFFLGGIEIDWHKGSKGHSDGDALIHAITDALLGAANLGDIGEHFPDTNLKLKGIDSKVILEKIVILLAKNKYKIINIDTTIALEKPKLLDYRPKIKNCLCSILKIQQNQLSIKAKTMEGFGFVGRQEAIVVYASVLIESISD